ncbi:hypothetical protein SAMN04488020_10388 [Palleronia marisminoris]|uniref:Uncharacterized protein n=1 Tax=Palleronia marisminoris TaxID=315423 RepID=A0A1Y5S7A3_9RHOB|nr:hypothetical protein [Palleronia marisminoris]SFG64877.1 hypothetical protein SAMN04488020_10388 [Palleronia marisminoris]SLN33546.1 hypothetical protein PAM7066_01369 [Palleronia marisminoris]
MRDRQPITLNEILKAHGTITPHELASIYGMTDDKLPFIADMLRTLGYRPGAGGRWRYWSPVRLTFPDGIPSATERVAIRRTAGGVPVEQRSSGSHRRRTPRHKSPA